MCGIVGFYRVDGVRGRTLAHKRLDILEDALFMDTLRGYDATGIMYHIEEGEGPAGYVKDIVPGPEFIRTKEFSEFRKQAIDLRFAVGHNRWATRGKTDTSDNAHPFHEGDITMVHNGTLHGDYGLLTPASKLPNVEVDSHALCHNLAEHCYKEVLSNLAGSYALVWYDARTSKLYIARNHARPMWVLEPANKMDKERMFFFGSEVYIMAAAMARNTISPENMRALEPGYVYSFEPDSLKPRKEKIPTKKYVAPPRTTSTTTKTTPSTGTTKGRAKASVGTTMREQLLKLDLLPTDRVTFAPELIESGTVVGVLPFVEDCEARLLTPPTGITQSMLDAGTRTQWLVRPVAVRYESHNGLPEKAVPVILCELIRTSFAWDEVRYWGWDQHEQENTKAAAKESSKSTSTQKVVDIQEARDKLEESKEESPSTITDWRNHTMVRGPDGPMPLSGWIQLIRKGCSECGTVPTVDEAKWLSWKKDKTYQCHDCWFRTEYDANDNTFIPKTDDSGEKG